MITYVVSDLFQSPAQVLVNAVNTVGVMGKGIAADFRLFFPEMFEKYRDLCERGQFNIGQLWLYKTPHKSILNFPTKQHWRDPSKIEYVEAGLQKFIATYAEKGITSISFPLLGSGLGGLDWETQVRPLMESMLEPLPINVYLHLYEPNNPFAQPHTTEALRAWLAEAPATILFSRFLADVIAVAQQPRTWITLDDHRPFSLQYDEADRRITLTSERGDQVILSESTLSDIWHYVRAAGYCLPGNLPAGLDSHADMVIALLTQLDYISPVYIARPGANRQIGLYVLPPLEYAPATSSFKVREA